MKAVDIIGNYKRDEIKTVICKGRRAETYCRKLPDADCHY